MERAMRGRRANVQRNAPRVDLQGEIRRQKQKKEDKLNEDGTHRKKLRIGKIQYVKFDDKTFIDLRYCVLFDYLENNVFNNSRNAKYLMKAYCGGDFHLKLHKDGFAEEDNSGQFTIRGGLDAVYNKNFKDLKESYKNVIGYGDEDNVYKATYISAYSPTHRILKRFSKYAFLVGNLIDGSIDALVPQFIEYNRIGIDPAKYKGKKPLSGSANAEGIKNYIESFLTDPKKTFASIIIGKCASIRARQMGSSTYQYGLGTSDKDIHIPDLIKGLITAQENQKLLSDFFDDCKKFREGFEGTVFDLKHELGTKKEKKKKEAAV